MKLRKIGQASIGIILFFQEKLYHHLWIQRLLRPALVYEFSYLMYLMFFWVSSWGLNLVKRFMMQMRRLIFQSVATISVLYTLNWSLQLSAWRRKAWLGGLLMLSGSDVQPTTLQQTNLGQTISNSSKELPSRTCIHYLCHVYVVLW